MRSLSRLIMAMPLLAGLVLGGCNKGKTDSATPPAVAPTTATAPAAAPAAADGSRRIDIDVGKFAYKPERITGKPGEKLTLVFHYSKESGECGHELLLPDDRKFVLDTEKPTEVAITMPADKKELGFTCGMRMLKGTLVVE